MRQHCQRVVQDVHVCYGEAHTKTLLTTEGRIPLVLPRLTPGVPVQSDVGTPVPAHSGQHGHKRQRIGTTVTYPMALCNRPAVTPTTTSAIDGPATL